MVLRGNSIATKSAEIYLRLVGSNYLNCILKDFVEFVINEQSSVPVQQTKNGQKSYVDYEVDGSKIQCPIQLGQNQANLLKLVQIVWYRILNSVDYFPS